MATIIKAREAATESGVNDVRRLAFNLDDMESHANDRLTAVRGEAGRILEQAREQADSIRRQAAQDGRQDAKRAAEAALEQRFDARMETLMPALGSAVREIAQSREAWVAHWQTAAVRLAASIAERIIRRELEHRPEIKLDLIQEALQMAAGSGDVVLRLHPDDAQSLAGNVEKLRSAMRSLGKIEVVSDEAISSGGCKVETRFGSIDQQIETQLGRLEEEILN